MNTTPNTLSPELKAQIEKEAQGEADKRNLRSYQYRFGLKEGFEAGAEKYALKLQQAEERIRQLEQWKKEAKMLLDPLLNWGQAQKDIPLGSSVTTEILRRAKLYTGAEEMMDRMAARLRSLKLSIMAHPDYTGQENEEWTDLVDLTDELLTEYNNYKQTKDGTANG